MKRILPILMVGIIGVGTAAAQSSASVQSGASAQSQGSVQTNKSGAQASSNGSASTSTSASANAGNSSVDISSGTKIDATLATSLDAKKNKPGDRVEARAAQDVKQDGRVVLKKGTRLEWMAWFDNSANNPRNPDPSAEVGYGQQSWDEMMIGFFDVAVPVEMGKTDYFVR